MNACKPLPFLLVVIPKMFNDMSFLLSVTPHTQCRLKLLKQERIKDYLLMEEEFIRNQEQMKPLEEKQEVENTLSLYYNYVLFTIRDARICTI